MPIYIQVSTEPCQDVLPSAPPQPPPAPAPTHCGMCERALNEEASVLSTDYGDGRCWGCVGQIEARLGNREVQGMIEAEIKAGLRNADGSAYYGDRIHIPRGEQVSCPRSPIHRTENR